MKECLLILATLESWALVFLVLAPMLGWDDLFEVLLGVASVLALMMWLVYRRLSYRDRKRPDQFGLSA